MENGHLDHPLLSSITTPVDKTLPSTTTSSLAQRVLLIVVIGAISIWANNEASKGFQIRVINDLTGTPAGNKFSLFYVSNDEATRIVQIATTSVGKILFSDANRMPERIIDQVDVRLTHYNLTDDYVVVTKSSVQKNKYVISLSPRIMKFVDFRYKVRKEIQRGIAEVVLFDKQDRVPETLLNGLVEYMSNHEGADGSYLVFRSENSGGRCWEDKNPKVVGRFLGHCEGRSEGFIGRLYQEMSKDNWDDHAVDKALGMTATLLCESFHNHMLKQDDLVTVKSISFSK